MEFQESIRKYCPVLEIKDAFMHAVNINKMDVSTKREQFKQFIFTDKDKTKSIILSYNYLIIEFKKYNTYDEFSEIVNVIFNKFKEKILHLID